MSVCFIPRKPHFYIVKRVYRGIHYFLIFALKHILWVLDKTGSMRRFLRVPTIYILSKNMKIVKQIQLKTVIFTAVKNRCILHGCVFVLKEGDTCTSDVVWFLCCLFWCHFLYCFHLLCV